jgi:putative transposase
MQISPSKVIKFLEKRVKPFFRLESSGRGNFTEDDLFRILVQMSIQNSFAEGTFNYQRYLTDTPSSDTFLRRIKNAKINNIKNGFCLFNKKTIKIAKRKGLFLTPVPIAIDWVDLMFYGDKETPMIVGTQHKKGSNYAYRYMTASILTEEGRFVIAVRPYPQTKQDVLPKIINEMLDEIKKEIKISHILFDRGFYNNSLISSLKNRKVKFLMHLPCHSGIQKIIKKNKIPFLVEYKSESHKKMPKEQFTVIGLEWAEENWFFATNIKFTKKTVSKIISMFRLRWGIETGYRMVNQFLPKTTSKNYGIRVFYFYFACLMYNAWILFNLLISNVKSLVHVPVLFFKNLLLTLFLTQKRFG